MQLPSEFLPNTVTDFIGPAADKARLVQKFIIHSKKTGRPLKLFYSGDPGVAKSALVRWSIIELLQKPVKEIFPNHDGMKPSVFLVDKFNGTDLTIDRVNQIAQDMSYKPIYSDWRIIWIDEFDASSKTAQTKMLTLLDDLRPNTAVFCTCNSRISELEQRIHSRFNAYTVGSPATDDIVKFLNNRWQIPPGIGEQIVKCATKNVPGELFNPIDVRQCLRDADGYVLNTQQLAA